MTCKLGCMKRLLKIAALLCLLILSVLSANAWADGAAEPVVPKFSDTRYFKEGDPDTTTSKCIGNPVTPLCAIDTWVAGEFDFYKENKLSEIARGQRPGTTKLITPPPEDDPLVLCYQPIGYWEYQQTERLLETHKYIKPGDVAVSIIWGAVGTGHPGAPLMLDCVGDVYINFYSLLLRKGRYGWYVLGQDHIIDFVRRPEHYR